MDGATARNSRQSAAVPRQNLILCMLTMLAAQDWNRRDRAARGIASCHCGRWLLFRGRHRIEQHFCPCLDQSSHHSIRVDIESIFLHGARTISPTSSGSTPAARNAFTCAMMVSKTFASSTVTSVGGCVLRLFDKIFVNDGLDLCGLLAQPFLFKVSLALPFGCRSRRNRAPACVVVQLVSPSLGCAIRRLGRRGS